MKPYPHFGPCLFATVLVLAIGCAQGSAPPGEPEAPPPTPTTAESATAAPAPSDIWWDHLRARCGKAFAGTLVSEDSADASFAAQVMVMHVRRCGEKRLEIPFHVGANRSRTWVLTRTARGIQLQHDHRHEDGSEDAVTLYGGHTTDPGTEVVQYFPADDFSKQLFEDNELSASVANIWSMEMVPGERFSYVLRRPDRHFQVDFDLSQDVPPPPAPWGHE